MANTIGTEVYRRKYVSAMLQKRLLKTLVAQDISRKFTWGTKYIDNPYGAAATANSGSIDGTYAVADYVTTNDRLTTDTQVDASNHIYKFEQTLSQFDLYTERMEELVDAVGEKIDSNVLQAYYTGAGTTSAHSGAVTAANIDDLFAEVLALGAGYRNATGKHYIVLTQVQVPVLTLWASTQGFNFADAALKNGKVAEVFGVQVYVVLSGQFATSTLLAGVKGVNSYIIADDFDIDEKKVTGKTGKEIAVVANMGTKVWAQKAALTMAISIA